ncbi:MAG: cell division protein ZapA [Clostridia bacterium]|nr:cell division protein ZapA [Clostridia bacterium]
MAEKKQIRFMINGKAYTLRHDEPEEYMHRIEHFLNTKVAAAAKADLRLEQQTAIVMAAISITDELFKTQKNFNTLKNEIKRMMDEYDRLKIEKQDLDEQLSRAEQQIDSLSKQLLLARHSVTPDDDDFPSINSYHDNSEVSGISDSFAGGIGGDAFFPAGDDIYDEE